MNDSCSWRFFDNTQAISRRSFQNYRLCEWHNNIIVVYINWLSLWLLGNAFRDTSLRLVATAVCITRSITWAKFRSVNILLGLNKGHDFSKTLYLNELSSLLILLYMVLCSCRWYYTQLRFSADITCKTIQVINDYVLHNYSDGFIQ